MTFRQTVKSSKKCEIFPYLSANHVVHHSFMYRRQQISGSETKAFLLTAQWVMWTSADLPQLSLLSSPTGVPWWNQRHLHTQWVALQEKNPWPTAKNFFFNVDNFLSLYWICHSIASVLCFGFGATRHYGLSSPTRDGIYTPCTGRQNPNPWTTREVPSPELFDQEANDTASRK